jgi:hypothetical protein
MPRRKKHGLLRRKPSKAQVMKHLHVHLHNTRDAFEESKHPRSHGQFAKTAGKRELPPPGNVQTASISLPQASAQEREDLAPYLERGLKRTPGKFSVKEVPISKLIATQHHIDLHTLANKMKQHDPELPEVFEMNGKFYIADGHHRIEAAKKNGKSVINVAVEHVK